MNPELLARLKAAAALPEGQINPSDPDAPFGTDWTDAVQGRFCCPATSLLEVPSGSDAHLISIVTRTAADTEDKNKVQVHIDFGLSKPKTYLIDLKKYLFSKNAGFYINRQ